MSETSAQTSAETGPVDSSDPAARQRVLATVESVPGSTKPDPILKVDTIVRQFGGMTAVDVGHLEVQRGMITALIGPNGAGKTTFFNLITGFDKPSSGRAAHWSFDGRQLDKTSASSVAKAGMVRTFQLTKSLNRMTVMDNMMLGAQGQRGETLAGVDAAAPVAQPGAVGRGEGQGAAGALLVCSRRRTTSRAACPAASASCWRWLGR